MNAAVLPVEADIYMSRPLSAQRLDDDTLVKTAATSVTARCAFPGHLGDLLSSLKAFESYSQKCLDFDVMKVSCADSSTRRVPGSADREVLGYGLED